jgi:ACR3 family arsenite efflux pump ArsB
MLIKILDNIQKYLFFWVLAVFVAGLSFVYFFGGFVFSPFICLVAALVMIYPSLVPLAFNKMTQSAKNYKIIMASVIVNFVIFPMIAYIVGYVFLMDEAVLRLGLILLALLPGGGMVTTWAMKTKADMPVTIGIVIINLLLAIVIVPFGLSFFMNHLALEEEMTQLNNVCVVEQTTGGLSSCDFGGSGITPIKIAVPIVMIVVLPLFLAYITQKIIIRKKGQKYFDKTKKNFGEFSNLGLLIVLLMLMSLQDNIVIFEQSHLLLRIFVPLILFYAVGLGVVLIVYRVFNNKAIGKSFVWGSYLRYITLALGIAISLVFQDERLTIITLVVSLSYFIQIPLSFVLSKYLLRLKPKLGSL